MQNRKGEIHVYADKRLQDILEYQLKVLNTHLTFSLIFHSLSCQPELLYEDHALTVESFPLLHRHDAPVCGFLFREKERFRAINKEMTDAWNVPVSFLQYLKKGEDFVTDEGQLVANSRLTMDAPPPRSYAYMTDTLYREKFAAFVENVDLLYHEATYGKEYENLAQETCHSTAEQAALLAKKAGVKSLILGHFSTRYPDPSCLLPEAVAIFPNTSICTDGDIFSVSLTKSNDKK
ncbi:hypothetical protein FACS1894199_04290 [Bacteroidia bacterium]|nr:hypothetical protein FACS1894199_04290 [Bacteroidia bacterium]